MAVMHLCFLLLVGAFISLYGGAIGAKILLYPYSQMYNSRFRNIMKIGQMMAARNHSVSMLITTDINLKDIPEGIEVLTVKVDYETLSFSSEELLTDVHKNPFPLVMKLVEKSRGTLDALFGNKELLDTLISKKFDLLFYDVIATESLVLRDYLNIPGVGYSNLGFDGDWTVYPEHPAYMPNIITGYSDHMSFWERLMNTLMLTLTVFFKYYVTAPFNDAKEKYNLNKSLSITTAYTRLSILIVNVDFAFDYPRPVYPWVKTVSGILFHPAKPLSKDLEEFVESSGEHGIIIMSFGSMVAELTPEKAEIIATVFAQLPQKIIWRNNNSDIPGLANNTKVMNWIPQNDLVGHAKARLFITHCGVSGSHEALYHGVPVVAVPLFVDQFSHATKFVERLGMGEKLDFYNITESTFSAVILNVLNNRSYFANAKRAAAMVRDQPMDGKETLMYWVEYVIRNNGTLHFHSQAMERLSWYQYLLLDPQLKKMKKTD
ncbi:UDP-glucuronosyltransferase 2C1 [Lingula anatina]|uniref:UDP-glucuronosyltransferase n=1 Tax=Lingula anatina TaxID=7574 RepID=A0A1S3GZ78_LINAN|nr:UDP-glucuronosyltransferase 2C1 [Lingula anatina]|eukprot:XP_013379058.1 UDP-glucuronosyltransferase 2C1 [Lingula anatina]